MSKPRDSRPRKPRSPTTTEIRVAREAYNLTQTEAGELIYCTLRGWQNWEGGVRAMHPAMWEFFKLKAATTIGRLPR